MKGLQPRTGRELAGRRPGSLAELARAGVAAASVSRNGKAILDRIARPRFRPGGENSARRPAEEPPTAAPGLLARLKGVRRVCAARLGLEEGVLCPNALLLAAARHRAGDIAQLLDLGFRHWQAAVLGEEIVALTRYTEG